MYMLSDKALLEAYYKAIDLDLEHEFIQLLWQEIHHRGLDKHVKQKKDQRIVENMASSF